MHKIFCFKIRIALAYDIGQHDSFHLVKSTLSWYSPLAALYRAKLSPDGLGPLGNPTVGSKPRGGPKFGVWLLEKSTGSVCSLAGGGAWPCSWVPTVAGVDG